eukprot:CAMPEP_0174922808 /NCGR_PEP_ID=MMETSP1355-20121228/6156_1 /TAXON_ID=464990 /ORGANISM="Hemiselmis tepida, Strain CCMP443" /LENGTH=69 /DNA_ID=CAMNT_0016168445 /DNA_START=34 /DNA_END=240 /DNA_ORIENTATION=-
MPGCDDRVGRRWAGAWWLGLLLVAVPTHGFLPAAPGSCSRGAVHKDAPCVIYRPSALREMQMRTGGRLG